MKNKDIANLFMRASSYRGSMAGVNISMPKLNGLRCMYCPTTNKFWSRDGALWNDAVLAHIKMPRSNNYCLDGELYCHNMTLQEITRAVAVGRLEPGPGAERIVFNIFDVLIPSANAWDRMRHLDKIDRTDAARAVRYNICLSQKELDYRNEQYVEEGYEGQMIKPVSGYYMPQGEFKRTSINLVKRKGFLDNEFVCVGLTEGEKRLEGSVGALVFTTPNGTKFEIGTGFTDVERKEFLSQSPIGRTATIKYLNLTEVGKPFNASFVSWRDDK